MQLHYLDLLNATLRTWDWKTLQAALSLIVYRYTEIWLVYERFPNKPLKGVVVSVSCSCALNLLNICAFTLHIRQTLVTFPIIHFPIQSVHLVKICKFMFLSTRCTRCSIFSVLMCLELWYVNYQVMKRATLIYLILISYSKKQNQMALTNWKFYIRFSNTTPIVVWGLGKK
jgi:hypothetical protein